MEFRELVRKKQALTRETSIEILRQEKRGVLSVLGDGDYPYGMPMNHYYREEDGCLYFHGGMTGHKIDAIRRHDKASFCVYDRGYLDETARVPWALNIRSVIIFGRIEFVEDREETIAISRALSCQFTSDEAYIEDEIVHAGPRTLVFRLRPEQITGKLVNES